MSDFRILDYNYPFESATSLSASSSDSAFPVSNLSHILRTKVWRSSGSFEITSSNNCIDFKDDSSGSELQVVIPPDTYDPETLAGLIGARMSLESVSSQGDTITCTYSTTTGRWTISTDGAYLSVLWSTGTNTANTIGDVIGFDASTDSTGSTSYTGPRIAIHTSERVVIDLGNTQNVDSFAVLFHPFEGAKFSSAATVKLQANAHPVWSSPSVNQTLTYDNTYNVMTHFFSSDQAYRYWSIEVTDPENPNLYVEIPKVLLANATNLTQLPNLGFTESRGDFSSKRYTEYGQVYVDQNPSRRKLTFPYEVLSDTDLESLMSIFDRVGVGTPIGIGLDTQGSVFDKDRFFIYGTFVEAMQSEHVFYNLFNAGFSIEETL